MAAKPRDRDQSVKPEDLPDAIREQLELQQREPFRNPLVKVLRGFTTLSQEDMNAYVKKTPDRAGQLLAILGRLNGYSERTEVGIEPTSGLLGFARAVERMSDAEIAVRLRELEKERENGTGQ